MAVVKTQQPARRSGSSTMRRAAQYALGAGTVLAIAAAFGPIWVVRAGIAIAIIAAFLAVRFAWKELGQARKEAGRHSLEQLQAHNVLLTTERERTGQVLQTLRDENTKSDEKVSKLVVTIGDLRSELSTLKGDKAALKVDLIERDHRIKRLRTELDEALAELAVLKNADGDADVVAIRPKSEVADWDALPSAEDLWAAGNHPTVVDLQKLANPALAEELRKQA